uniref:PIPK domain-containing protein n=1 Tax=Meloidogyne incognita TaxID=6306 RepID=A0A914N7S6_MELIC
MGIAQMVSNHLCRLVKHKSCDELSISELTKSYSTKESFKQNKEEKAKKLCSPSNIKNLAAGYYDNEIDENDENKLKMKEIGLKTSIQLALRKYLCSLFNGSLKREEGEEFEKYRVFKKKDENFPHNYKNNFKFSMYFTKQFQLLWKNNFKIKIEELIISLTEKELKGFENPAKSNSIFFTSVNGKFFLKSVNKKELDFFLKQDGENYLENERVFFKGGIHDYFNYVKNGENSFLPQLFAFFKFEEDKNSHYFFIQNGLFPENIPCLDFIFDLKGASYHRWKEDEDKKKEIKENKNKESLEENEEETKVKVYKELDFVRFRESENFLNFFTFAKDEIIEGKFPNGILLKPEHYKEITTNLERDSDFLAKHKIVDYSLLLGIVKNNGEYTKDYTKFAF